MSVKIRSTRGLQKKGIKVLVFGKAGIGKTTLMATAPKPIILSCEAGLLSLAEKDVPYIEIESVQDVYDAYHYVDSRKGRHYDTICLDSISDLSETVLSEFLKVNKHPVKAYGEMADEMTKLLKLFRDLKNKNVVISAKRLRLTDEDSGMTQYVAGVPGKAVLHNLPYLFDEVFYLDNKEGSRKRVIRTQPGVEYDAKDRSGKLNSTERPDLGYIFDKIKSGRKERKRKVRIQKT